MSIYIYVIRCKCMYTYVRLPCFPDAIIDGRRLIRGSLSKLSQREQAIDWIWVCGFRLKLKVVDIPALHSLRIALWQSTQSLGPGVLLHFLFSQ